MKEEYRLGFEEEGVESGVMADDRMMPDVVRPVQTHSCIVSDRHIDLQAVNTKQLLSAGISLFRIHPTQFCTYESVWLPSWRRNPTDTRLLTWIAM